MPDRGRDWGWLSELYNTCRPPAQVGVADRSLLSDRRLMGSVLRPSQRVVPTKEPTS